MGSGTSLPLIEMELYFPNRVGRKTGTRELLNALSPELDAT